MPSGTTARSASTRPGPTSLRQHGLPRTCAATRRPWRSRVVPVPSSPACARPQADRRPRRRGRIDDLLCAVADEALFEVFVTDTEPRRIHPPHDGGAGVVLATPAERDRLRDRHADWLSSQPASLWRRAAARVRWPPPRPPPPRRVACIT
ncbi:DUF3885 domain-containing protein [Streptomyces sp. MMG1121]|uniref:DUF3885 domain-containing protein n=1 Tax=Streptomyces sp. MMG1121 TaxID=1415544 RepID=UPI003B6372FC